MMQSASTETVAAVLIQARSWLGTPYRHQASTQHVGCDCLGLLRGVWRVIYGAEPEQAPAYSRDGTDICGAEPLLTALQRHMPMREGAMPEPGDVIAFRWRSNMPVRHLGIMDEDGRFLHAYEGKGVVSSALVAQWRRRIAGLFIFPDLKG